ncbi:MAG: peptide chain release factor 1 [Hyphomicrobiales bacterium]|nr:peptide chain release factor 1 [Hyphomicrobiales bacterium]
MLGEEKLAGLIARLDELTARLAEGPGGDVFTQLSKEYAELEPVAATARALMASRRELAEARSLAEDAASEADMRAIAREEQEALAQRIVALDHELAVRLLPKDAADERGAILEVRAGTGGDEASLFAGDLVRMYERYAALKNWKFEILSVSEGTVGGYKEAIVSIVGKGVFARLKFESGVHRVQRVPQTETSGRIHTSAATVAVLPEVEDVDINLDEKDLKIETMRAGGAGGQHVNKTESAVRIVHIPTGITVVQMDERSQHRNRATAMKILSARVYELERGKLDAARAAERRGQIGSGDRSERVRTYNFPQGRVSDHRIELTLYKIDKIMIGEALDEIIDPLISEHQAQLLAVSSN